MNRTLFDFTAGAEPWAAIDDVVMGGRSRSRMDIERGVAVFHGHVSLENRGGFASVRSAVALHDLSAYDGIELRLRGDGKHYGLRLRDEAGFDGVNFQAPLDAVGPEWTTRRLPFGEFLPSLRGRRLTAHPPLNLAAIRTFGLIIAGRQAGPFRLELAAIESFRHQG